MFFNETDSGGIDMEYALLFSGKQESEGRHSNFIFGEMPIIADMFSSLEKK